MDPLSDACLPLNVNRVVHHAVVLEFTGPSVRAEVAEERAARTKRSSAPTADA